MKLMALLAFGKGASKVHLTVLPSTYIPLDYLLPSPAGGRGGRG